MTRLLIFFNEKFLICRPLIMEKLYGIDRNFENIVNIGFKCIIRKIIFREYHYFYKKLEFDKKIGT